MLPYQYEKFSNFADIGLTKEEFRAGAVPSYSHVVNAPENESKRNALNEEKDKTGNSAENWIGIMTDARHGCRKNSYHSDVLALGIESHKVIAHQHVTKNDERCSQKHELHGTKEIYETFGTTNIKVKEHAHDRNSSISKIEKVPRGIRGEKSSKDMASSRDLVSTIGALASPKMGDGTRCPEG